MAAVLKTAEEQSSEGSNPSLSASFILEKLQSVTRCHNLELFFAHSTAILSHGRSSPIRQVV